MVAEADPDANLREEHEQGRTETAIQIGAMTGRRR